MVWGVFNWHTLEPLVHLDATLMLTICIPSWSPCIHRAMYFSSMTMNFDDYNMVRRAFHKILSLWNGLTVPLWSIFAIVWKGLFFTCGSSTQECDEIMDSSAASMGTNTSNTFVNSMSCHVAALNWAKVGLPITR